MVWFFHLVRNRQTISAQEKKYSGFSCPLNDLLIFFFLKFSSDFPFLVNSTVIPMMNWPLLIHQDFSSRKLIIDREWQNLILIIHLSSGRASLFYRPMLFYSSNTHTHLYIRISVVINSYGGRNICLNRKIFYHIVIKNRTHTHIYTCVINVVSLIKPW